MPFNPDHFPGLNKSQGKNTLFLFSRRGTPTCRPVPTWEQFNLVYLLRESVFPLFGLRESKNQNYHPVFLGRIVYLSPLVSEYLDHESPSVPNSRRLVQRIRSASQHEDSSLINSCSCKSCQEWIAARCRLRESERESENWAVPKFLLLYISL